MEDRALAVDSSGTVTEDMIKDYSIEKVLEKFRSAIDQSAPMVGEGTSTPLF
jgi:hypothetical protein